MLYREIIVVCSEIHAKYINTLCGQNVEFVNVKLDFNPHQIEDFEHSNHSRKNTG